jgi:nicotinate dehydrogenase subunit B
MTDHDLDLLLEPERYELQGGDPALWLDRRDFARLVGGGLIVACLLGDAPNAQAQRPKGGNAPRELGAWLHVAEDSAVTVYTGKVEVGQNVRTSLTQVVAEELRLPVGRITLVMADTDRVPYDGGTAGSRTTPAMAPQLRRAAAAARELLLDLAVEESRLKREALTVSGGKVEGPRGKPSFTFGQLSKGKKLVKVIDDKAPIKPVEKWTVAGTSVPKVDGRAFVTGSHKYTSDVKRPKMLFGAVLRPPSYGAKLGGVKTEKAEAMPGVVVAKSGDFVGVVAPTDQEARKAVAAIEAEWKEAESPVSGEKLFEQLKKPGRKKGGFGKGGASRRGSVKDGLAAADKTVEANYTIAYIAHVPLEPRAAVAEWADGKLTVWTGTQMPFRVRGELASAFGLSQEKVRVIVPDTGSGYGGKHTGEAALEAARLAKAAGKPVKLVWTREEEFTWAYFRPAGVIESKAGVKKDGTLTAWEFHNYNSGASAIATPYVVANYHTEFHASDAPLKQGSYRALASPANCFARECLMDDLAAAVALDPLEFRLKNLKDARLRAVLQAAAKQFGWGKAKPAKNHGFGLACGTEKGGYAASCAEVEVDQGSVRVKRLLTAFECGAILNPDHLTNQIEGCMMMALGGALFEQVQFKAGKITNPRFSDYRVPRFRDLPALETVLVNRKDLPSVGAGEAPMIAVAPAVGNAIFHATGKRLRSLPLVPDGFKA